MDAVPPFDALPSAVAPESLSAEDERLIAPGVVTWMPSANVARELEFAIVTATAAATLTPPPDVEADGVFVPPEPAPPLEPAVLSAWFRSPCTWPSTLWLPSPLSSGAPAADALAEVDTALCPVAWNPTGPPAVRSRRVVAATEWLAIARATAAPIAALELPLASPAAVLEAEAFIVASTSIAPETVSAGPEPIDASALTVESVTATAGATETFGEDAPVFALVVAESVTPASTCRSCTEAG